MNLWDQEIWSFIVVMVVLLLAMMTANMLQNICAPLRRLMVPGSVLGGFLVLLTGFMFKRFTGHEMLNTVTLEMLTYHGLGLGFSALALRNLEKKLDKPFRTGGFDSGVAVVCGYLMQALLGLGATFLLYKLIGSFFASGMLLPMGYGQGPGNAYSWGHTYEMSYGFTHGTSFGLSVAAMGFVAASIGGVVYLNILRRKGVFQGDVGACKHGDDISAEDLCGKDEIPVSESLDKFTVQVALVFFAYGLAYLFLLGINAIVETGILGGFGKTLQNTLWPFNFLLGTLFALMIKAIFRLLRRKGFIQREYSNNYLQNRIAGFMFDMMVIASIAAIDLSAFSRHEFLIPLVAICLLGAVSTFLYMNFICKRVFSDYRHEAFLSLYGMQTGTASTGVILLRELDPRFESMAASNLVYHQPWAILFGFPMLLLLGVAPQSPVHTLITLGACAVLFIAMNLVLFRRSIFKKK